MRYTKRDDCGNAQLTDGVRLMDALNRLAYFEDWKAISDASLMQDECKIDASSDLISRKNLTTKLCDGIHCGNCPFNLDFEGCLMEDRINEQLSAEPVQKTGRWVAVDSFSAYGGDEEAWMSIGNPIAYYYCSVCKEQNYLNEEDEPILSDYCPSCGARLKEGV